MINAPSLFNCDFMSIGQQVDELVAAGISVVHVDVMDGHYVPNLAFPTKFVADLKHAYPELALDVHLMVTDPFAYLEPLSAAGADCVSFPSDSTRFVRRAIEAYQERGMQVGVVLNPSQTIETLRPYARLLDYAVLMTVEPGFAGQPFLPGSLERLEELSRLRDECDARFAIEIDGGITHETGAECVRRGADVLVTGIYVTFDQPGGIAAAVPVFAAAMSNLATDPRAFPQH